MMKANETVSISQDIKLSDWWKLDESVSMISKWKTKWGMKAIQTYTNDFKIKT